ncbi:unnamed protein product [Camellia sinensis]
MSKLDFAVLSVTPYQTGIDSHAKDINLWFQEEASEAVTTYRTHEQRLVDYISFRIPEDSFSNIRNCIGIARGFMHDLNSVKKGNASLEAVLLSVPDGYHCESQIVLLLNESTTSSESSSNGCMMIVQAIDLPFVSISRSTGLNRWNLHELKMENEKVRDIPHFVVAPLAVSGTATIEGLSLNLEDMLTKSASGAQSQNEDFVAEHAMFNEGNSLKRRRRGLFSFLRVIPAFTESFSESDEDDFKTDACLQMHPSRLLQLNNPDLLKNGYCRLKYICNKEGLKASSIALTALAEYTVGDQFSDGWPEGHLKKCF